MNKKLASVSLSVLLITILLSGCTQQAANPSDGTDSSATANALSSDQLVPDSEIDSLAAELTANDEDLAGLETVSEGDVPALTDSDFQ